MGELVDANYYRTSPYLDRKKNDHIIVLTGFPTRVRLGNYGKGNKLGAHSVIDALGAISKTIEMGGRASPIYREQGKYLLPLEGIIEGYSRENPPLKPQLDVLVLVAEEMFKQDKQHNASLVITTTAQLGLNAFYFLLRVGQYTIIT